MYHLKQVKNFDDCEQIQALFSDLPANPYCTNTKGFVHIRTKNNAIKHAYIQPNHPNRVKWLVFDIDDDQALFAYHDNNAPRPTLIVLNGDNGHAHYCYKLAVEVGLTGKSSAKAIKYLDAVYNALRDKLNADKSYSCNLIKNPTHARWRTYTAERTQAYTLEELAQHLDLTTTKTTKSANEESFFYGRNHEIFDTIRHDAYKIADKLSYKELYNEMIAFAQQHNATFKIQLQQNELHHIAKSITRFCKSSKFGAYSVEFREKQREKGSKGGRAKGDAYSELRAQAIQLRKQNLSVRKIAEKLNISKSAVSNYLKSESVQIA